MKTLKDKLDKVIEDGVIQKVDEPTECVHSLVLAKKKGGDLRLS